MSRDLAPWEIPPDEAYWQALLTEGEYNRHDNRDTRGESDVRGERDVAEEKDKLGFTESDPAQDVVSEQDEAAFWDVVAQYQASGMPIELTVTGFNRGGLLVDWNGLRGFVPASQICTRLPHGNDQRRNDVLAARVGETLKLKVIECEPDRNHLILSERILEEQPPSDHSLLDTLSASDICRGQVTNLCTFGAFVDLGGVEGLIHISELSWGRVSRPEDVLQSGQEVEVYVLSVDPEQGRVSLSLKRLQPDPWAAVEERFQVGQLVEGTVTSVVSFGAFVRLEEGLEGLIHVSKLQDDDSSTAVVLDQDQAVQVCIMSVDGVQRRIGLGLERILT
ncbi:MAG: S1 RNA-binding domain-containing protein [Anaerolineae bacterium]|nr:S1 RNA-binding domain-containing protein [Anaerolineae bacterium]